MKEFETMKVYGKVVNTWKHMITRIWRGQPEEIEAISQYEITYKTYDANGDQIGIGTEDFSAERYNETLKEYRVFVWDGVRYNKGGYRWFDEVLTVKIDRKNRKLLKDLASIWFPKAAEISIR